MADKLPAFIQKPKEFLQGTLSSLKSSNADDLLEKYTSEMTVVAEGLWADQQKLRDELAELSAQQTINEKLDSDTHEALANELQALSKKINEINKSLHTMEGKQQKLGKRNRLLTQITAMISIAAFAWITVTIINALAK